MTNVLRLLFNRAERAELKDRIRRRKNWLKKPGEERTALLSTRDLENLHSGQRCFVLGAGSSISRQDLNKLQGETVISVSNTFVHPLFETIRPRYHVLPPLLSSHGELYSTEKFVSWLREMEQKTSDAAMVLHIGDRNMIDQNGLFRNRSVHWVDYISWNGNFNLPVDLSQIPKIWSVSETAVTLAVYLGFSEIYLIGFDHDWFNGKLVYFFDHTKEHAMKPDQANLDFADAEFQMRRHADIFRKYKYLYSIRKNIYNANENPSHYMDVFPKVDFDEVFLRQ
ncbi:Hypothetical protein RG1141_PA05780 (plasmid) [Neorhizobium galegae bv. officinalis bv. officinalis str. HAMBI 1141]|uniref:Uncharacterized protein n=1 Tax=Neorhizobium galegae bv. officinalis bv. officinalis str. HAMBI 1141 TaxID=1028801 RepID=A0A068TH96_NEOGA|nr:hypothetical protein [Neorhizobium galegae]CDN57411.1 Hypothetical protein RG1141_PA05780 [Neorhizobium galegae bv. officinalis bv. officinalis str. HAMBI 1141]